MVKAQIRRRNFPKRIQNRSRNLKTPANPKGKPQAACRILHLLEVIEKLCLIDPKEILVAILIGTIAFGTKCWVSAYKPCSNLTAGLRSSNQSTIHHNASPVNCSTYAL
ncbi:uncharacterized protein PpBr36_11413 [Pyricularia pennisetigena]|uniref:uncharacterized protein n=1 Tax=Pyricularia pennisetigena TaxID=1578925 RepID=UPI00114EA3FB|nr:uncharacterized protein PpBr36_11413 [Pyricularia pennisetigena]TLS20283.1 hypothetical protein PpBr36_11413 [Pyricularia pennisetigena]